MLARPQFRLAAAAILLTGCGGVGVSVPAPAETKTLTIELARAAPLPAGTQARVRIVAISTPDQRFIQDITLPVPPDNTLQVQYDASRVDPRQDYNVEVIAVHEGKRIAGNAADAPALTKGRPDRIRVELK